MKSLSKRLPIVVALFAVLIVLSAGTAFAGPPEGKGPKTGPIWICPSVSTNNPNGMWVIGGSGAYYIIKPGTASPNWPMILNPTGNLLMHAPHVEDLGQVPAGWGLYHDWPTYPNYSGWAMVLDDGAEAFGLEEGMQMVTDIPISSAVFW